MNKPVRELKKVIAWMEDQMWDPHGKWYYGNEHDAMSDARDLLETLIREEMLAVRAERVR